MPCHDPPQTPGDSEQYYQGRFIETIFRLDKLTELLCQACRQFEVLNLEMSPELKNWWLGHKAWDEVRARNEVVR